MDDNFWMYRVSPKQLHMMNYCNGVEGLVNYTLSNPKNISGGDIKTSCKNKNFINLDVMMHVLQKKVHEKTLMPISKEISSDMGLDC